MGVMGIRAAASGAGAACLLYLAAALASAAPVAAPAGKPPAAPPKPARPAAPVLAVETAGNEVLTRVLNPSAKPWVSYRVSDFTGRAAGGLVAVSLAGNFHFLAGPDRTRTYTYTVQAVTADGQVSAPGVTNVFTSGTTGQYQTSFAISSESVTAFAQAGDSYVSGLSGTCGGDTAYSSASRKLSDSASRAEKVRAADPAMLARWGRAFAGSDISTKGCAQAAAVAEFTASQVDSFLAAKRSSWVTVRANWTTSKGKGSCYLRMISGDANGRTTAPWVRDVLTVAESESSCRMLPRPWL